LQDHAFYAFYVFYTAERNNIPGIILEYSDLRIVSINVDVGNRVGCTGRQLKQTNINMADTRLPGFTMLGFRHVCDDRFVRYGPHGDALIPCPIFKPCQ
jgi:hypothetical protein